MRSVILYVFLCLKLVSLSELTLTSTASQKEFLEQANQSANKYSAESPTTHLEVLNETSPTDSIIPYFPIFNDSTNTKEEFDGTPNKGFWEWLQGILTGGNNPIQGPSNEKPPESCPPCTCGLTNVMQRIVGGVVTKVNLWVWMVALKYNNRFFCGGSAINSRYILTAGHCTVGIAKERLVAVFMEHDRSNPSETQTFTKKIIGIYRHRSYNVGGSYNNDVALLKLEDHLTFGGSMRPVCLPIIGKSYSGWIGKVLGWGATAEFGQVSALLREVDVPILSNEECTATKYGNKITSNMLCAGYPIEGGKDACQGDSGGPLLVKNGSQHMIAGIVSWGEGCAEKDYPGVYTRVNRFITWIKSNTKDACYC